MNEHKTIFHLCCLQALQHPDTYLPDFISGPMDRNKELSMALHRRAKYGTIYLFHRTQLNTF